MSECKLSTIEYNLVHKQQWQQQLQKYEQQIN